MAKALTALGIGRGDTVAMMDWDSHRYLQITDRVKNVIKTGGKWILSSLEPENIISRHAAVSEAAVIGIPDPKWVERPLTLVVLKLEMADTTTQDELKAFFDNILAPCPGYFFPLDGWS